MVHPEAVTIPMRHIAAALAINPISDPDHRQLTDDELPSLTKRWPNMARYPAEASSVVPTLASRTAKSRPAAARYENAITPNVTG